MLYCLRGRVVWSLFFCAVLCIGEAYSEYRLVKKWKEVLAFLHEQEVATMAESVEYGHVYHIARGAALSQLGRTVLQSWSLERSTLDWLDDGSDGWS